MNKLSRLNKLENLLKIEERKVLAEFKQVQRVNTAIQKHIDQLERYSRQASKSILTKSVSTGELHVARSFSQKVAAALTEVNARLGDNEKKFVMVGDKIRHVRSRIKSIQRLINKHQVIENNKQQSHIQKEIEANINYLASR